MKLPGNSNYGRGIHTECRPDDTAFSNTTNSLVESILELRQTLQQRLRTNVLYAAKTKVDEFLELLGQPEYDTDFLSQPVVEKAARSQENDIHPTPEGPEDTAEELGSRIPPIRRGGGRFVGERSGPTERPPFFNVQLIAHFDANVWQILVEVGAEETEWPKFAVQQGSGDNCERLQEIQPFTFGPLRDLRPIRILSGEVVHREKRLDRVACPIFFRVVQNDFGRHVANPLQGLNLAMVPANWKYDSKKSGPPPHEPEACSLPGYMLHYFSGARSPVLAFDPPDQNSIEFHVVKPRFFLEGSLISDADKKEGVLFVGAPPILRHVNGRMESIRTVVIGEEGRGTEKWRREYKLGGANMSDWPLPDDILRRGSGWYFVRLYDAKQDLIDSLDVRYIPHLRTINVRLPQLKQSADEVGVSIEFVHGGGLSVASVGSLTDCVSSVVGARGSQNSYRTTIFEWPFNPKIREASFAIVDGGKPVHVTFETDRIWWALFHSSQRDTEVQWGSSSVEVQQSFLHRNPM